MQSALRGFRVATWLGWQIESNWADPFLFIIYSVLKPIASVMILVVMYLVISRSATDSPLFGYIYLGNAFYMYVGGVMTGVSWAVVDDREHYSSLKYIYVAPIPYVCYLLGRGVARLATATTAVLITLVFGILVFGLPISFSNIDVPLFLSSWFLGIASLAFLGLAIGGGTLLMTREAFEVGEAFAGALYIFSGAIFPLSILPAWLQPIGWGLPITYWLVLVRRSLLGITSAAFPTFAEFGNIHLLAILAGLTCLYGVCSLRFFKWAENRAKRLGRIDIETHH